MRRGDKVLSERDELRKATREFYRGGVHLTFRVPKNLHAQMRAACERHGISKSELIRRCLWNYIRRLREWEKI